MKLILLKLKQVYGRNIVNKKLLDKSTLAKACPNSFIVINSKNRNKNLTMKISITTYLEKFLEHFFFKYLRFQQKMLDDRKVFLELPR